MLCKKGVQGVEHVKRHTQAKTAEVNTEDQGRDSSHSARGVNSKNSCGFYSSWKISVVGIEPATFRHQMDILNAVPADLIFFDMPVICQPKAPSVYYTPSVPPHFPTHSEWHSITITGYITVGV